MSVTQPVHPETCQRTTQEKNRRTFPETQNQYQAGQGSQFQGGHLLDGRGGPSLAWVSLSSPILSFKPSLRSGMPDRKHFIKIFPVTSHRKTVPAPQIGSPERAQVGQGTRGLPVRQAEGDVLCMMNAHPALAGSSPFCDMSRFTPSTMSKNTCHKVAQSEATLMARALPLFLEQHQNPDVSAIAPASVAACSPTPHLVLLVDKPLSSPADCSSHL